MNQVITQDDLLARSAQADEQARVCNTSSFRLYMYGLNPDKVRRSVRRARKLSEKRKNSF